MLVDFILSAIPFKHWDPALVVLEKSVVAGGVVPNYWEGYGQTFLETDETKAFIYSFRLRGIA